MTPQAFAGQMAFSSGLTGSSRSAESFFEGLDIHLDFLAGLTVSLDGVECRALDEVGTVKAPGSEFEGRWESVYCGDSFMDSH